MRCVARVNCLVDDKDANNCHHKLRFLRPTADDVIIFCTCQLFLINLLSFFLEILPVGTM